MKSEEKKNDIECAYCQKQFKYESEKKRHEESHTPRFQCKVCLKKFSFLSALRRHEKQHDRVEDVRCTECNHKFRDEALLKRHMNYAHKGTFICDKCSAKFNSDVALRTHLKTHKPVSERRFHCHFKGCSKTFNFQHHLKHHEMTHTNTKQYHCSTCGFIQYHHLKTHMKTHSLERYHCTVVSCKKIFTNQYARKRHLATHATHLSTIDSGISSSDSNSGWDITDLKEEELLKCLTCSQLLTKEQFKEHVDVCKKGLDHSINSPVNQVSSDASPQDLSIQNIKDVRYEVEDFRSCKAVLGGCIVSQNGEVDENCLCAQISSNVDYGLIQRGNSKVETVIGNILNKVPNGDPVLEEIPNVNKNMNSVFENNFNKSNAVDDEKGCIGCACNPKESLQTVPSECKIFSASCDKSKREMPELEYRIDGTIKLKETFDSDIEMPINVPTVVKTAENKEIARELPFNNCKSVLGKCIATESGSTDGCLCAKMAFIDSVDAEEIDEITPHPVFRM
ncbi:zinc finger protein 319-like isoform X2 [Plodia interpunctella]|uniref:zinc finger protein 319-like isoform X2 n=1 Tax=Plodia interpunctella TaxID=58824 RepID=UPI002368A9B9|nr:zinc finger protein 319-like isoform X2 [Plodia interpunctella]